MNKSSRFNRVGATLAVTTVAALGAAGCGAGHGTSPNRKTPKPAAPAPSPSIGNRGLHFLRQLGGYGSNASAGSCAEGEVRGSDFGIGLGPYPHHASETYTDAIAASEKELNKDNARLIAGATVAIIGKTTVEIATSDDKPGVTHIVNLAKSSFAAVLHATDTYEIVLSVREDTYKGDKFPSVVMNIDCLDNGNFKPGPPEHLPLPPHSSTPHV